MRIFRWPEDGVLTDDNVKALVIHTDEGELHGWDAIEHLGGSRPEPVED